MDETFDKMEREAESALASLCGHFAAEPTSAVLDEVRSAVRHELNELWLAERIEPPVPEETLPRVRSNVHAELERCREGSPVYSVNRWSSLGGLAAAAAMIGICFGIIQFAASLKSDGGSAGGGIDLFVQAGGKVIDEKPITDELLADLDALEENITTLQTTGDQVEDRLESIGKDIENLFTEPETFNGTS